MLTFFINALPPFIIILLPNVHNEEIVCVHLWTLCNNKIVRSHVRYKTRTHVLQLLSLYVYSTQWHENNITGKKSRLKIECYTTSAKSATSSNNSSKSTNCNNVTHPIRYTQLSLLCTQKKFAKAKITTTKKNCVLWNIKKLRLCFESVQQKKSVITDTHYFNGMLQRLHWNWWYILCFGVLFSSFIKHFFFYVSLLIFFFFLCHYYYYCFIIVVVIASSRCLSSVFVVNFFFYYCCCFWLPQI